MFGKDISIPSNIVFSIFKNVKHLTAASLVSKEWHYHALQAALPSIGENKNDSTLPEDTAFLADGQRRLLLIENNPSESLYNWLIAMRINGALDIKIFQACLKQLIERHVSLRTNLISEEYQQKAIPINDIDWQLYDYIHNESLLDTETDILSNIIANTKQKINLSKEIPHRSFLYKLQDNCYIWAFIVHHSVFDGYSQTVFLKELSLLYNAQIREESFHLPKLKFQYLDYCNWQDNLASAFLNEQIEYWKKQLKNVTPLNFPTDNPRPKARTYNGKRLPIVINQKIASSLSRIAKQNNTSLYTVLLANFLWLMHKYTYQNDIAIGTVTSNRKFNTIREDVKNMIGFIANTIIIRAKIEPAETFNSFLNQTIKVVTESIYRNSTVSFGKVIEHIDYINPGNRNPFFDILFVMQDPDYQKLNLDGLTIEPIESGWDIAKFDLALELRESDNGLIGFFEYNTDLFIPSTIERIAQHFQIILEKTMENLNISIENLDILTKEEETIFELCNETGTKNLLEEACSIPAIFESAVTQYSKNPAVTFKETVLTYREINNLANQAAKYFQKDQRIGICVERTIDLIVAMLAVLKAGGIVVLLETSSKGYGANVNKIREANCTCLIMQSGTKELIPSEFGGNIYTISDHKIQEKILKENFQIKNPSPNDLALIPFTSGTTGQPKGMLIKHIGWYNWAQVLKSYVKPGDNIFFSCPHTFDASFWEIFSLTFPHGATLHINPEHERIDNQALMKLFKKRNIQIATFIPSFLNLLEPQNFPSLKLIFVTGEVVSETINRWLAVGVRVINGYGQTEATAGETLYECTLNNKILIGKPIANTQIYILDPNFKRVPIGVWGEIYVSSIGLTEGYINNSTLNQQKFLFLPFTGNATRFFRTGDRARFLEDGNIEFGGRIENDKQIKIYGVRVELEEIEETLMQHPAILLAAVKAWKKNDTHFLVAYVVFKQGQKVNSKALKEFLINKGIQSVKLPSIFREMQKNIPFTPNGKLDKSSLPEPKTENDMAHTTNTNENDEEHKLLQILDLLAITFQNKDDELYLDSFTRMRLVNLINKQILNPSEKPGKTLLTVINLPTSELTFSTLLEIVKDTLRTTKKREVGGGIEAFGYTPNTPNSAPLSPSLSIGDYL